MKGEKKEFFQVGYTSNPVLNVNKAFKEQVEINLELIIEYITIFPIRKVMRKENTRVLSLLMLYEKKKIMVFNMLGSVFFCIIKNRLGVDYLCLQ